MRYLKRQSLLILLGLFMLGGVFVSGAVNAQVNVRDLGNEEIPVQTEVIIPGSEPVFDGGLLRGRVGDLAGYLGIIYNFLISIVGVVAGVFILVGGFQYVTAGGDAARVTSAKQRISSALIGFVLALSSFVLLNTINPQLVNLKVPSVTDVTTQLAFLPWCEQIKDVTVTPVGDNTTCGYLGKFQDPTGQAAKDATVKDPNATTEGTEQAKKPATQYCMYVGSCSDKEQPIRVLDVGEAPDDPQVNNDYKACLQKQGLRDPAIEAFLAEDPKNANVPQGECLWCADITLAKAAQWGYSVAAACSAWEVTMNALPAEDKTYKRGGFTVENGLFFYCGARTGFQGCVGAELHCYDITRNEDEGAVGDCDDPDINCACEGYDESPGPTWARHLDTKGFVDQSRDNPYYYDEEGLEDYPEHLGRVCALNPCKDYVDPKANAKYFINGCKGAGISREVAGVRQITADCRNNQMVGPARP